MLISSKYNKLYICLYITRLHCVMGQQKTFRNIEEKSAIVSEFVMLIGPSDSERK